MGGLKDPPILIMECVIVGNGESLKDTPLFLLSKKYDVFACNRIHLIYPSTPFRPKYYVRTEPPAQEDESQPFFDECRLHILYGEQCIFPSAWKHALGEKPNIEWVNTCHHFEYDHRSRKAPKTWHLPFLCDFGTTVTVMMQIAVLKGYTKIILVGCDLNGGHFSQDYDRSIQTDLWIRAHEIAAQSCPIPIVNATVGGILEAYPKKRVEELL